MTVHPLNPIGLKSQPVSFKILPPLALYIHIPWCVRKCPYCDFNSHEIKGTPSPLMAAEGSPQCGGVPTGVPLAGGEGWGEGGIEQQYITALIRDLEQALPLIWGRRVQTVFIGGGTPSLFSGEAIAELLRQVRMRLPLEHGAEITLEANPGAVEAQHFAAYREAGVNRLSLGIQSFDDEKLRALGRIHTAEEARAAIKIAQQHFDNINLDLMYALPDQSLEQALQDVRAALAFSPQHLSCYHLTLEPNTLFAHNPPQLPDDDAGSEMQHGIEELLAQHGYEHYETSAFAQPKHRAKHNLNYWQFGDYLGIGAGAHGKLSFPDKVLRQARYKQPREYLEAVARGAPVQEEHALGRDDLAFEFMMNALRLNEGFDEGLFQERTSLPLLLIRRELEEAVQRGLLKREQGRIAPTGQGRRFLNDLLGIFLKN